MERYHPYQPAGSTHPPASSYLSAEQQVIYNAGIASGRQIGRREALEAAIRLLQDEMLRSPYSYPLTTQGAGMDFPARVTASIASMPPTLFAAPTYSHYFAPPLPTHYRETYAGVRSPLVSDTGYRGTAAVTCQPQTPHESTSVTTSGYLSGASLLPDTQTTTETSARADEASINPDISEHTAPPSTAQIESPDGVSGRVTPEEHREPASPAQSRSDPSDNDDEIDVEG